MRFVIMLQLQRKGTLLLERGAASAVMRSG